MGNSITTCVIKFATYVKLNDGIDELLVLYGKKGYGRKKDVFL